MTTIRHEHDRRPDDLHLMYNRKLRLDIGAFSYFDGPLTIHWFEERTSIAIGRYCSFAEGAAIMAGGDHHMDRVSTYPLVFLTDLWPEFQDAEDDTVRIKGPVSVGHDVWVGNGALILPGVTVGHGSVIGARSVVSKDVEPYTVVAGNPARPIRTRLPPDDVAYLLDLAWWNWDHTRLRRHARHLFMGRVAELREALAGEG